MRAPVFRKAMSMKSCEYPSLRNISIKGCPGIRSRMIRPDSGSRSQTAGTFTPRLLSRMRRRDSLIILRYPRRISRSGCRHLRGRRSLRTASRPIHVPAHTSASAPRCKRSVGTKAMMGAFVPHLSTLQQRFASKGRTLCQC